MRNSNSGNFKIETESEISQIINSKNNTFIEQNFVEIINSKMKIKIFFHFIFSYKNIYRNL